MEASQIVLRELHRKDDESLYYAKYYIQTRDYYLEMNTMYLIQ
jgi:hypothetical protein